MPSRQSWSARSARNWLPTPRHSPKRLSKTSNRFDMKRALFLLAIAAMPVFAQDDIKASAERGKAIYNTTCMSCHMITGQGVPGAFPPLAKTEYVSGDTRRLVAIALKGITGPMTVDGKVYQTPMPQPDTTFPVLKEDKNVADV